MAYNCACSIIAKCLQRTLKLITEVPIYQTWHLVLCLTAH